MVARVPLLAGNWKMNMTLRDATNLVEALLATRVSYDRDVVICPPFTLLHPLGKLVENRNIKLGAQDVYWEPSGA
ncbi:MAG: triose-phosphate isomerase, partial [Candidatus Xenobia bacterium]